MLCIPSKFSIPQGLPGLRAMDKRHMTLYIPLIFIMQLFMAPKVETLDNTILLGIELARFTDIIRKHSFSDADLNEMTSTYCRSFMDTFILF